jgi:hypothetical protein
MSAKHGSTTSITKEKSKPYEINRIKPATKLELKPLIDQ